MPFLRKGLCGLILLIGELRLCPVDKYLIGEGHILSQGSVKSFALTQTPGRSVFSMY